MFFAIFIEESSMTLEKTLSIIEKMHLETSQSEKSFENGFPWRTPTDVFIKQLVVEVVV